MVVVYYLFYLDHFFKDSFKSVIAFNSEYWIFTWEHAHKQSRNTLGDKLRQYVATTRRSDKSLRVSGEMFVKIFVSATEFCRCNKSQKNQIRLNLYDVLWQQNLLQRQRFLQKFSNLQEAICRCCSLSPSMHRPLPDNSPTPPLIGALLVINLCWVLAKRRG